MAPRWRLVAPALAAVVLLRAAGAAGATESPVRHAIVHNVAWDVEIWRDPAVDTFALRGLAGARPADYVDVVRGRTVARTYDGRLSDLITYRTPTAAWKHIEFQYGLERMRAEAALAAGDTVPRPALMDVPDPANSEFAYTRVFDFDTDVAALRRAAGFAVPAPGHRLAGLTLAKATLVRRVGPRKLKDSGPLAGIYYSSAPDRLGTDDTQLALNVASERSGYGSTYASSYREAPTRLRGRGYELRLTEDGDAILRYRHSYVLLRADWAPTLAQWRTIAALVAP